MTVGYVSFRWTCIALHSVNIETGDQRYNQTVSELRVRNINGRAMLLDSIVCVSFPYDVEFDCIGSWPLSLMYFVPKQAAWGTRNQTGKIIRIFHGCEMRIEKSVRGSLLGITMPNSDPEGWNFLSTPINQDIFFFLHTFSSTWYDYSVGVAINELHSSTLTSAILKVDVVCYVAMMSSSPNVLTT